MHRLISSLAILCFFLSLTNLSAQSLASVEASAIDIDMVSLEDNSTTDWSFYSDVDNQLYYIDFEKLNFNLNEIVVKNADNDIVIKEDVLDLPVDIIFELDFSTLSKGTYTIELRSFKGVLTKEVTL